MGTLFRQTPNNGYPFPPKWPLKMGTGLEASAAHPRPNNIWVPPPPPGDREGSIIDKENKTRIKQILAKCGCNKRPKELVCDLSKAALLASFVIFYSRHEQTWSDAPYMSI